uniref:Head decoration protein n=1 Tax=viral metagenome TaxID=1070528 RepID=A0A6M3K1T3_9ZZZZ
MPNNIDYLPKHSGRLIGEDNSEVNVADLLQSGIPVVAGTIYKKVTIAAGASLSDEADVRLYKGCCLYMPAAWTTAGISFTSSLVSGGTFNPVDGDDGNEITLVAAASRVVSVDIFSNGIGCLHFIKLQSGTSAAKVNQVAEAIIFLGLKG